MALTALQNVGVLDPKTNQVTDSQFKKFVQDVINKLKTGESTLPGILKDIECTKKIEPIANADEIKLDDETLYPDFHKLWKEKYTATAQSIDSGGGTPLAAAGVADPTAIASDLGLNVKPENAGLPKIFGYLAAAIPGGPISAALGFSAFDTSLMTDVTKQFDLITKFGPGLVKIPNPLPEVPTTSMFNLQTYLDFGYSDKVRVDLQGYIDQLTVSKLAIADLVVPSKFLEFISPPEDFPKKIIEYFCKKIDEGTQSNAKPLVNCDFQEAARNVRIEHSANMQVIVAAAQILGNGQFVGQIARNPPTSLGLQFTVADEEVVPGTSSWIGTVPVERPGSLEIVLGEKRSYNLHDKAGLESSTRSHKQFQETLKKVFGETNRIITNQMINQLLCGLVLTENGGGGYGVGSKGGFAGHECPVDKQGKPIEGDKYKCVPQMLVQSDGKTPRPGFVKQYTYASDAIKDGLNYHLTPEVLQLIAEGPALSDAPGPNAKGATFHRLICALRRRGNVGGSCKRTSNTIGAGYTTGDLGDAATKAPDLDDVRRAADAEMVMTYSLSVYYQVQDMLYCLNKPWAMPMGTADDATAWFRKRWGYKRNENHFGPFKDANTGWQPA